MAKAKAKAKKAAPPRPAQKLGEGHSGISAIQVEGFKSIRKKTAIAIKPLTILAGANSSGKSSIMQPLLLMKQTLEAPSDPGVSQVRNTLLSMIHVPAMHGSPERTYRATAVGPNFPGTFEPYVASIIHQWQITKDIRLRQLGAALERLGLTWKVEAARVDDTRFELHVGRLKKKTTGGARDLVSIADVGFGVSQCLPVLVALLTAQPDQLVYIEEPEMHLHPRAQVALAQILADTANRGVRVVIETHSSFLLLGVQALVAEGALPPELVALHWFSLDKDGVTEVRSADLDETGAFGDWPEDFAEVTLDAQARYLDAAEKRLARAKR